MNKTPELKAISKHRENILRLQTWGKLRGFEVNEETISKMKQACIAYFEEHPETSFVPASTLISCLEVKSPLRPFWSLTDDIIGEPRREKTTCEICGGEREVPAGKAKLSPFCASCLKATESRLANWNKGRGVGV